MLRVFKWKLKHKNDENDFKYDIKKIYLIFGQFLMSRVHKNFNFHLKFELTNTKGGKSRSTYKINKRSALDSK